MPNLSFAKRLTFTLSYPEVSPTISSARHDGIVKGERSLVPSWLLPIVLALKKKEKKRKVLALFLALFGFASIFFTFYLKKHC